MKITLCGSCAFVYDMEAMAVTLTSMGHEVQYPPVPCQ